MFSTHPKTNFNFSVTFVVWLTHYQTTNFRPFQTERVCRRQFQILQKWQKVIQMGRKHCGKRRNCLSRAISPFPTVFSKGLVSQGLQKVSLCGNALRVKFQPHNEFLITPKPPPPPYNKAFENIVRKGENACNQHFLLFPRFQPFPKQISIFQAHLICPLQMLSIWTSLTFCCLVNNSVCTIQ